jgi:hypothetical protein
VTPEVTACLGKAAASSADALYWQRWEALAVTASVVAGFAVAFIALFPILREWRGTADRRDALRLQLDVLIDGVMSILSEGPQTYFTSLEIQTRFEEALRRLEGVLGDVHILSKDERCGVLTAISALRNAKGRRANLQFGWIAMDAARMKLAEHTDSFVYDSRRPPASLEEGSN